MGIPLKLLKVIRSMVGFLLIVLTLILKPILMVLDLLRKDMHMEAITFVPGAKAPFKLAIMIKEASLDRRELQKHYMDNLVKKGIKPEDVVCIGLRYVNNKALKKPTTQWIVNNLPILLNKLEVKTIAIADSNYFKYITGNSQSKYIKSFCKPIIKGLEHLNCVPLVNYRAISHNSSMQSKMLLSLESIPDALSGLPSSLGTRVVKHQYYPDNLKDVKEALDGLLEIPRLAVDLETFSLDHRIAGIGTISFSPDEDTCIAFKVQYETIGERTGNSNLYRILKKFFELYQGVLEFHRGQYDIKVMVYELFMRGASDWEGLVHGLDQFKNIDDSMLMTYVCTNNTIQNVLNLKDNTMDFAGNYAIDIKDITLHEPDVVLEYNGRDTCNTVHLIDKYKDRMVAEGLQESYEILLGFIRTGVELEIRGLPMNMDVCIDLYETVGEEIQNIITSIVSNPVVNEYSSKKHISTVFNKNLTTPTKIYHINTCPKEVFNPNSDIQVADLIHTYLGVKVVNKTKTGLPSMTTDSLTALKHSTKNVIATEVLDKLIRLKEIQTSYTNFIVKFVEKSEELDETYYLHGNIKLCTTISGRPTGGGDVNLLALPSTGSVLAKPVKQCFSAGEGRLMLGADYSAQEDMAASIISKDPEMLRGKILGIDGHSARALAYFPEELPEHTKLLKQAEKAQKFYIDDSKTGLDKFTCK